MVDNLSKENRSKNMRAIKSIGTTIEDRVSKELWHNGIRFRRNVSSLYGKPDISIKKYKVVIFVDSCFWHGCKEHYKIPNSNKEYWIRKIENNRLRDEEVTQYYCKRGWTVFRIWEHELKKDFYTVLKQLIDIINKIKTD